MKLLNAEFSRENERGSLVQLFTGNFKQLNLLKISKGEMFGGHYHKKKTEFFYLIEGEILVNINGIDGMKDDYIIKEGECFLVEPYDKHSITAIEDCVLIETLSKPYSKEDTYE